MNYGVRAKIKTCHTIIWRKYGEKNKDFDYFCTIKKEGENDKQDITKN